MFFTSYAFAADQFSMDTTPPPRQEITWIQLQNGIFDELLVTRNANMPFNPGNIDDAWYVDTVLHAYFEGDLEGGNMNFLAENVDALRIRRRTEDGFTWVSLYEKPVTDIDSFDFDFLDITARSNTTYEYSLVPISGGVEGDYIIRQITTCFPGLFIMEPDKFYRTDLAPKINDAQQNRPSGVVTPIGRRFPIVVSSGLTNYRSGSASAIFALKVIDSWDLKNAWKFREDLALFLADGVPKLMKYEDGRMRLIMIGDPVNESGVGDHPLLVSTSWTWTEIGDCDANADLYTYGFTELRQ